MQLLNAKLNRKLLVLTVPRKYFTIYAPRINILTTESTIASMIEKDTISREKKKYNKQNNDIFCMYCSIKHDNCKDERHVWESPVGGTFSVI